MKPAPFDYLRAESREEVLAQLHEHGDQARIIAGGQSLVPMLSMRLAKPALLVDVMHVESLARIEATEAGIRIGAGVRQAALLEWSARDPRLPLLARALPWVGHAQTRNRGTVVGSIAHADPSAEQLADIAISSAATAAAALWASRSFALSVGSNSASNSRK